jgi:hypothetical protein
MAISDLRQIGGFPRVRVSPTNTTECLDITEILLKVALNTLTLTITLECYYDKTNATAGIFIVLF